MSTKKIGSTMYVIAIIGLIAILTLLFSERLDDYRNPNRAIESISAPSGTPAIVLQRNRYGHYVANGELNGVTTELMLDTGATDVAVSVDVAARAGLPRGPAFPVSTANGSTYAYATVIESVRLGDVVEYDVRASIVPNLEDPKVLLGMSFLKRLDFSQSGDTLILRSRRAADGAPAP
jgi:aspartyl protease family protein